MFDRFARYYDLDYGAFDDDVVFYREMARFHGGAVLEVMCGTGRVALPLAQAGVRVTGIDIAPAMIAQAQVHAKAAGLTRKARFLEADARHFRLDQRFGFAFVAVNSLMHLETTADQHAALRCIHHHLNTDGLLAIDVFNPNPIELTQADGMTVLDKTFVIPETGHVVQKFVARSVDFAAQHIAVTFMYDEIDIEGRVQRTVLPFGMRWVYRFELEHMLALAGFRIEAVYGSYDLDPYETGSERLLMLARRIAS